MRLFLLVLDQVSMYSLVSQPHANPASCQSQRTAPCSRCAPWCHTRTWLPLRCSKFMYSSSSVLFKVFGARVTYSCCTFDASRHHQRLVLAWVRHAATGGDRSTIMDRNMVDCGAARRFLERTVHLLSCSTKPTIEINSSSDEIALSASLFRRMGS